MSASKFKNSNNYNNMPTAMTASRRCSINPRATQQPENERCPYPSASRGYQTTGEAGGRCVATLPISSPSLSMTSAGKTPQ